MELPRTELRSSELLPLPELPAGPDAPPSVPEPEDELQAAMTVHEKTPPNTTSFTGGVVRIALGTIPSEARPDAPDIIPSRRRRHTGTCPR
jgi:hypothetical protein